MDLAALRLGFHRMGRVELGAPKTAQTRGSYVLVPRAEAKVIPETMTCGVYTIYYLPYHIPY